MPYSKSIPPSFKKKAKAVAPETPNPPKQGGSGKPGVMTRRARRPEDPLCNSPPRPGVRSSLPVPSSDEEPSPSPWGSSIPAPTDVNWDVETSDESDDPNKKHEALEEAQRQAKYARREEKRQRDNKWSYFEEWEIDDNGGAICRRVSKDRFNKEVDGLPYYDRVLKRAIKFVTVKPIDESRPLSPPGKLPIRAPSDEPSSDEESRPIPRGPSAGFLLPMDIRFRVLDNSRVFLPPSKRVWLEREPRPEVIETASPGLSAPGPTPLQSPSAIA